MDGMSTIKCSTSALRFLTSLVDARQTYTGNTFPPPRTPISLSHTHIPFITEKENIPHTKL